MALVRRVTSPCRYDGFRSACSFSASAASSAPDSSSCCAYCSWFRRAACSFNCSSVMRSRCGCRLRSACMRASSRRRSCCVIWSSSWRASPAPAPAPSVCPAASCRPSCAAWSSSASSSRWPCCMLANSCALCSRRWRSSGAARRCGRAGPSRRTRLPAPRVRVRAAGSRASVSCCSLSRWASGRPRAALQLGQLGVSSCSNFCSDSMHGLLLLRFLRGDLGQVGLDLRAALVVAFLDFGLLHGFDLQRRAPTASACRTLAHFLQVAAVSAPRRPRRAPARWRASSASIACARSCLVRCSRSPAGAPACRPVRRRRRRNAPTRGRHVARAVTKEPPGGSLARSRKALAGVLGDEHVVQPVGSSARRPGSFSFSRR
jgi:hypothetical protein